MHQWAVLKKNAVNTFFWTNSFLPWVTTLHTMSLKFASCKILQHNITRVFKVWADFPKRLPVVGFWRKEKCCLTWLSYLLKCLPSPGGLLSLTASEPSQSVCSTADSKDSFVTTRSSKASKDCPVGFAVLGSVSVVDLQFSVVSSIFVCMSCWSHDLTL